MYSPEMRAAMEHLRQGRPEPAPPVNGPTQFDQAFAGQQYYQGSPQTQPQAYYTPSPDAASQGQGYAPPGVFAPQPGIPPYQPTPAPSQPGGEMQPQPGQQAPVQAPPVQPQPQAPTPDPVLEYIRNITGGVIDDPAAFATYITQIANPTVDAVQGAYEQKQAEAAIAAENQRDYDLVMKSFQGQGTIEKGLTNFARNLREVLKQEILQEQQMAMQQQAQVRHQVMSRRTAFFSQNPDLAPVEKLVDAVVNRWQDPDLAAHMIRGFGPEAVNKMLYGQNAPPIQLNYVPAVMSGIPQQPPQPMQPQPLYHQGYGSNVLPQPSIPNLTPLAAEQAVRAASYTQPLTYTAPQSPVEQMWEQKIRDYEQRIENAKTHEEVAAVLKEYQPPAAAGWR